MAHLASFPLFPRSDPPAELQDPEPSQPQCFSCSVPRKSLHPASSTEGASQQRLTSRSQPCPPALCPCCRYGCPRTVGTPDFQSALGSRTRSPSAIENAPRHPSFGRRPYFERHTTSSFGPQAACLCSRQCSAPRSRSPPLGCADCRARPQNGSCNRSRLCRRPPIPLRRNAQ